MGLFGECVRKLVASHTRESEQERSMLRYSGLWDLPLCPGCGRVVEGHIVPMVKSARARAVGVLLSESGYSVSQDRIYL